MEDSRTALGPGGADEWLQPPAEAEGLTRYVSTLRERFWLIVMALAVTIGVAILYLLTAPKVYEASADLLITPTPGAESSGVNLPQIRESSDPTRDVETASRLVTNTEVAERVANQIDSSLSPSTLQDKVTAEPIAQSNIVAVIARASTPEEARDIANGFATAATVEQTDRVHDYIEEVLPGLEEEFQREPSVQLENDIGRFKALLASPDPTIRVDTEATLPSAPVAPRPLLTLVGAILAGLMLGIVGAFALQILDPRLRREEQLRRLYRLPILARIPRETGSGNPANTPLRPTNLSPAAAEAYRTLRGTLAVARQAKGGGDSRAILVTGSSPSEGKTTTAVNLATSLAATGNSVILIEADLRRPSIGRALGITPEHGVVSVLIDNVTLEDALVITDTHGANLGLLLADYEGGWIAEPFFLPAATTMVNEARRLADYVIIDSPPLTDVVDALPLAQHVDDVLLVTRLGKTQLSKLSQLGEMLAENGIKPAGFALIGTRRPTRSDYSYYGAGQSNARVGRTLSAVDGSDDDS